MIRMLRYALASVCFAISVGCLALWGWTISNDRTVVIVSYISHVSKSNGNDLMIYIEAKQGEAILTYYDEHSFPERGWKVKVVQTTPQAADRTRDLLDKLGIFFIAEPWVYLPIWYPALVFALAGVGVIRFRRQFSIRSALVAVSVVAALLGMAVIL